MKLNLVCKQALGSCFLAALVLIVFSSRTVAQPVSGSASNAAMTALASEVHSLGWIVYGARTEKGDWDLFASRPDGSDRRNLTSTSEFSEFSPQVSRDGTQLLYRRVRRDEVLDNNNHGTQGVLVFANADGSSPKVYGAPGEFPWASWSPDGTQIASLSITGVCLVDIASHQTVARFPRKGFFQQMTWSPDGKWLCGVANSFGTGWSIARMNAANGEVSAVNRVDCCTPDWFPDTRRIIFSWRPPGQKANKDYGWTQLWMADSDGNNRKLLYAEAGRHVYGGNVSPDGRYALFTGNMKEDGDPGDAGAPMGLVRVADAPIIPENSGEARAQHPAAGHGPVLSLPPGWEPCWTAADIFATSSASQPVSLPPGEDPKRDLAEQVKALGWIAFSARTDKGDWDLFIMRPDGSNRQQLTHTPDFNEAGVRFSPRGKGLLYYRVPRSVPLDNNTYGAQELVLVDGEYQTEIVLGKDYSWASWSPDGKLLACLSAKGIQIIDPASTRVVRELLRKGIVEQLIWSPDGKHLVGTANGLGQFWNVAQISIETGDILCVSENDRYNCTPDWLPNSLGILYSRGIIPESGGKAELWMASLGGKQRRMVYAEEGRHIYGGCASPDGRFVVFTRSTGDLGQVEDTGTVMGLIRFTDAPMVGDNGTALKARFPDAKHGPRLDLPAGWEPHWTANTNAAEIFAAAFKVPATSSNK